MPKDKISKRKGRDRYKIREGRPLNHYLQIGYVPIPTDSNNPSILRSRSRGPRSAFTEPAPIFGINSQETKRSPAGGFLHRRGSFDFQLLRLCYKVGTAILSEDRQALNL